LQFAQVEIEETRADVNADFVEELVDLERVDEGRLWKQKRAYEKKWRDPDDVYIDVEPQTLRGVFAKGAMHHGPVQISRHPHPRTRPATRSRLGQYARLRERTTGKEEGGKRWKGCSRNLRIRSDCAAYACGD
jgi:hypothetical protein